MTSSEGGIVDRRLGDCDRTLIPDLPRLQVSNTVAACDNHDELMSEDVDNFETTGARSGAGTAPAYGILSNSEECIRR